MHERVTVDFRCRREQKSRALRLRETEGLMGAERPDLERLDRQLQVIDRACRAREVQHTLERPFQLDEVGHVVQDQLEARVAL